MSCSGKRRAASILAPHADSTHLHTHRDAEPHARCDVVEAREEQRGAQVQLDGGRQRDLCCVLWKSRW